MKNETILIKGLKTAQKGNSHYMEVMNLILSVDDFEGHEPKGKRVEDTLPLFSLIFGWAKENALLSDELSSEVYNKAYISLRAGNMSVLDLAVKLLDGKITRDMFKNDNVGEWVSDYISTGTFIHEVENYFDIGDVFSVPRDWESLSRMLEQMNVDFDSTISNYLS